jgi:putative two-component system response regulator
MLKESGYHVRPVPSGKLALQAAAHECPDLVLLDINMPDMDGYEVCRRLKADPSLQAVPVLFISALSDTVDKVKAFASGAVDFIVKPFEFPEVEARVRTHLQLRQLQIQLERHNSQLQELVEEKVKEVSNAQMATIVALAKLAEARDDDTGRHIERTQTLCRELARCLKDEFPEVIDDPFIGTIFHASPLHDIGKVAVPDAVLLKPGKLTDDEFSIMKQHTVWGAQTLAAVRERHPGNRIVEMGMEIARSHHERWDGTGYPDGLVAESIPIAARIMALVDVYDALRSKRCYKEAFSHERSVEIIAEGRATHFDPRVVDVFLANGSRFAQIRESLED